MRRFEERGHHGATLIHPLATVGPESRIDEGAVICAGVQISTNVTIGRHVHVNPNATIDINAFISGRFSSSCAGKARRSWLSSIIWT